MLYNIPSSVTLILLINNQKVWVRILESYSYTFSVYPDIFVSHISDNFKENYDCLLHSIPDSNFFKTLETLLSYENGALINLLSKYLFSTCMPSDTESSDAVMFSKIIACITRLHDSTKKQPSG